MQPPFNVNIKQAFWGFNHKTSNKNRLINQLPKLVTALYKKLRHVSSSTTPYIEVRQ